MFGKNKVMKYNEEGFDGTSLRVVGQPWYTIQGEGPLSGLPAIFLRLHGCNLRCTFCDTEFSDPKDPVVAVADLVKQITGLSESSGCRTLVVTGGEPLRQPLHVLFRSFPGWTIQIETAGTLWQPALTGHPSMMLVVSPKTALINPDVWRSAHAFKYIVRASDWTDTEDGLPLGSTQLKDGRPIRIARPRPGVPVYLQPCDEYDPKLNEKNLRAVARIVQIYGPRYGYRAGVQLHKLLEVE